MTFRIINEDTVIVDRSHITTSIILFVNIIFKIIGKIIILNIKNTTIDNNIENIKYLFLYDFIKLFKVKPTMVDIPQTSIILGAIHIASMMA